MTHRQLDWHVATPIPLDRAILVVGSMKGNTPEQVDAIESLLFHVDRLQKVIKSHRGVLNGCHER